LERQGVEIEESPRLALRLGDEMRDGGFAVRRRGLNGPDPPSPAQPAALSPGLEKGVIG